MAFFTPTAASGNGSCLATFGRSGELMGFFYPRIDFAQNVREAMPALRLMNVPREQGFLWTFADCWRVAQSFEPASNVLITRLAHRSLNLSIEFTDVLPPDAPALVRRIVISKAPSVGPVQFMHYFHLVLGDSITRNSLHAYADRNLIVQHFRNVAVALTATQPFAPRCGSLAIGQESATGGTKAAMLAGDFGGFVQAIGRVDFAVGFEPVDVSTWQTTLILAAGADREAAIDSAKRLVAQPFESVVQATNRRVNDELADAGPCSAPELADAFERAVISLHDLYDATEGTFIAAPEFDPAYELSGGYGYCWPRDAAVCALAIQRIGRPDMARRFFEWAGKTQLPSGHWYQRYWTDGLTASSWCVLADTIQLDQTCAIVHSAGQFARRLEGGVDGGEGRAFVERFRPVADRAVRAILDCVGVDYLHKPATDLWENSVGSFPYTQAAVIAALCEADQVFGIDRSRTGMPVRVALRERLLEVFWQPDRQRWLRRITPEGQPDTTMDSSAMGIIDPWSVLDLAHAHDRLLAAETLDGIDRNLRSEVKGGGAILRFEGESYVGGGPGCVNTLWLAVCRLKLAAASADPVERQSQRALALDDIRVALANTNPTGQLPELIPKMPGLADYWAAPHAWACSLLIEATLLLRSLDATGATAFDAARSRVRRRAPSH